MQAHRRFGISYARQHALSGAAALARRGPGRTTHLILLSFVTAVAVAARVSEPEWVTPPAADSSPPAVATPPATVVSPPAATLLPPMTEGLIDSMRETPASSDEGEHQLVRTDRVDSYIVEEGDSLVGIAARQGIAVRTLLWANELDDPDIIQVGQELIVPPVDGVLHTIAEGETLNSIAARYSATASDIIAFPGNEITDADVVTIGKQIFVPGGVMPEPAAPAASESAAPGATDAASRYVASGSLQWPTTGPITTYFRVGGHRGLDIAPPFGTPIYAADAGRVVTLLRWDYSFGWHIVLDHGNGMTTLYAHLSRFAVDHGEWVEKGQVLGYVGSTGYSTGPHLHFEVAVNGQLRDPFEYLR